MSRQVFIFPKDRLNLEELARIFREVKKGASRDTNQDVQQVSDSEASK